MNDKIIGLNSDKDIYTSPYGAFTQQNLIDAFVEAKNQLPKNSDVSILKSDIFNRIVRNWKYSHYMTNFVEFNPKLKEKIKQVDREMLVNYFIEKFIYQKAMADSLGMKSYLNQNLNDYTWPTRYQTNLYVCKDKEVQNKVVQFLEQGKTKEEIEAYYRSIPTENHSPWLYVQSGKIPKENDVLPKQTQYKIGVQPISTQHKNYVVQITQEIPPSPMTVTEAGTVLQEAYKNYIFLQTLSELRKNAVIKINR